MQRTLRSKTNEYAFIQLNPVSVTHLEDLMGGSNNYLLEV